MAKTNALLAGNAAINKAKAASVIDYGSMLKKSVEILNTRFQLANDTTVAFLNNMPEDFSAEIVPVEGRELLTNFLRENKDRYAELSKTAGKYSNRPTSEEYLNATRELDKIKNSFASTKESLENFSKTREDAANNVGNWSPAMTGVDQNTYKEIIGKEAYKNLEYTTDGIFYTDAAGKRTNINDLSGVDTRASGATDALYTALDASAKAGGQGLEFTFDENGNPSDLNSRMVLRNVNNILLDKKSAADLFIGGVPGYEGDLSTNPSYQYINEQASLGNADYTSMPVGTDGNVDFTSDEYLMKLEELKSNVPTEWLSGFVMDMMKDANSEGFGKYNESVKTKGGKGSGFGDETNFAGFFTDLYNGSMMKIPGLGQKVQYAKYNTENQQVEIYNSDRATIGDPMSLGEFMGEVGVPQDARQKVLDYFTGAQDPVSTETKMSPKDEERVRDAFPGSKEGGKKMRVGSKNDNDDDEAVDKLRTLFPDIEIDVSEFNLKEKIRIADKDFKIRSDDFDPQQVIDHLNDVMYGKKSSSNKVDDALNKK